MRIGIFQLNMSVSSEVLDAGDYINISMTSTNGQSLIGIKAVDVSSILMGEQNDISHKKVKKTLLPMKKIDK